MSKFKEERDAAAELNPKDRDPYPYGEGFEHGANWCLESSVVIELVESMTNLLERSRERADDHEFPNGDGYYDWADKCHQLLATYSEALAEIRGEK